MERVCFTFDLHPGTEDEYRRRHEEIPPELVRAILESGFRNHTLFRRGLQVIAYAECHPDADTAFAALAARPESARWSESLADVIVTLTDAEGRRIAFDEVWHLHE